MTKAVYLLIPVGIGVLRYVLRRLRSSATPAASGLMAWVSGLGRYLVSKRARAEWARRHLKLKYFQSVERSTLLLPGTRLSSGLQTDRSYTPLQLRTSGLSDAEILHKSGSMLLLGEAGSGKSALASMLVRRTARIGAALGRRGGGRLPVCIELKDLALTEADVATRQALWAYMVRQVDDRTVSHLGLYDSHDLLDQAAKTDGWMIVLDGLDEVRSEHRPLVERAIIHLIALARSQPGDNLLIVTARQQVLQRHDGQFIGRFDEVEYLGTFSVSGIYSFLLRYPYRSGSASANAHRLLEHLRLYPHLLETCRNPLALNLLVGLDQRSNQGVDDTSQYHLPETRAVFFQTVVDEMLIHRRRGQLGVAQAPNSLRRVREQVLQGVAHTHLEDSASTFNRISEELILSQIASSELLREGQTAADALDELAVETGLIARCAPEHWEFAHRSFLDYFAGKHYATQHYRRERSRLLARLRSSPDRFEEALYFSCGLMVDFDRDGAESYLQQIRREYAPAYLRACLEAQLYSTDTFVAEIQASIRRLTRNLDPAECSLLDRVIRDYCRVCAELGRPATVSRATLLQGVSRACGNNDAAVRFLVDCNISMVAELPATIGVDISSLDYEEVIRGCYEPESLTYVMASALEPSADPFPWAAVLSEAALRSAFVSDQLRRPADGTAALRGWGRAWPIRGTLFAHVLTEGMSHLGSGAASFPHLGLLGAVRHPSRTRRGDSIRSMLSSPYAVFMLAYAVALLALSATISLRPGGWDWRMAVPCAVLGLLYLGLFVRERRRIFACTLPRLLNLQPEPFPRGLADDILVMPLAKQRRWILVSTRAGLAAGQSGGAYTALYDQQIAFVWRVYAPLIGRSRLRQAAAARVQQWDTEVLRSLFQSTPNRQGGQSALLESTG